MRARTKTATVNPMYYLAAFGLAAAAALLPLKARAADTHGQIVNAMTHADLAGKAANLDGVHMHLHHAVNCLVGPNGAGYDAKQMNPCANAGNGAIPDTTDAAQKKTLDEALKSAQAGIAETDLAKAQADATSAAAKLKTLQ